MSKPFLKIGVLGAGQLGRMLALAGYPLGVEFSFYDPSADACARHLGRFVQGSWQDFEAMASFCESVDRVTFETENLPGDVVSFLKDHFPDRVAPSVDILAIAQDRYREKTFFQSLGVPTAPFFPVDTIADLEDALRVFGFPLILKTRRSGYDGKGQFWLQGEADLQKLVSNWAHYFPDPMKIDAIAEKKCDFVREWSLIAARQASGEMVFYNMCLNHHESGILRETRPIGPHLWENPRIRAAHPFFAATSVQHFLGLEKQARSSVQQILQQMAYIGVLTVEFFEMAEGQLLANEMAPRVHNSGHWSIEGAVTSQFENHIRALAGWPLGETAMIGAPVMTNWIGEIPSLNGVLKQAFTHPHVYGKMPKKDRKVGHLTIVNPISDIKLKKVV